jgi:A/G-specific adenine glycosylase
MKQTNTFQKQLSEIVVPLLHWYDNHARILPWRENPEPYAVWISEIMLQQTRVEAVKPYFERWLRALPDIASLAEAQEQEVMKLWEGLGYYSRVRNLQKAAGVIMENYNGRLPASYEELLKLPGIGEYTAGAVGSIAFQLPVPCVDGNVLRVVTRLAAEKADITTPATKKQLTERVKNIIPKDRPGDFNQAMMELGATVCLPNGQPKCGVCPIAFLCEAHRQDRTGEFPVKRAKQPRKMEERTVLLLLSGSSVALKKRPDSGLLAGLWEFPNFPGHLTVEEITNLIESTGHTLSNLTPLKKARHIFTHIEWNMTGYLADTEEALHQPANAVQATAAAAGAVKEAGSDYNSSLKIQWIDADLMRDSLTLPSAFKAYNQVLTKVMKENKSGTKAERPPE